MPQKENKTKRNRLERQIRKRVKVPGKRKKARMMNQVRKKEKAKISQVRKKARARKNCPKRLLESF